MAFDRYFTLFLQSAGVSGINKDIALIINDIGLLADSHIASAVSEHRISKLRIAVERNPEHAERRADIDAVMSDSQYRRMELVVHIGKVVGNVIFPDYFV